MQRLHSIVGILLFTAVTQAALAQGNEKRKTVLDGVFTAAQAERGKEAYATHCSTCHMEDLGGLSAPALKGEQFIDNWREDSVRSLFTFIRTQMPQRAAGSLEEKMYVDILAHILSVNMFPSGSNELNADALGSIDLVGKDGPAPIPKFALIALVGCLARADGEEWKLDNASAPARSRCRAAFPQKLSLLRQPVFPAGSGRGRRRCPASTPRRRLEPGSRPRRSTRTSELGRGRLFRRGRCCRAHRHLVRSTRWETCLPKVCEPEYRRTFSPQGFRRRAVAFESG